ncbi:MAG: hypothetical protein QE263_08445 [Vampirovibrionales bacterium]|nr:hypothetical protein [Vampirovibrionales bacterium]
MPPRLFTPPFAYGQQAFGQQPSVVINYGGGAAGFGGGANLGLNTGFSGLGVGGLGGGLGGGGLGGGANSLFDVQLNNLGLMPNAMGVTPFQEQLKLMGVVEQQQAQLQQQQQQLQQFQQQQLTQQQQQQAQQFQQQQQQFQQPLPPEKPKNNLLKWLGIGVGGFVLYKLVKGPKETNADGEKKGFNLDKVLPFLPALLPVVQTLFSKPGSDVAT